MASLYTSSQFFCFIFLASVVCTAASTHRKLFQVSTNFILSSCRTTRYPVACYNSLESYASKVQNSPRQLAHAALSVSVDRAVSTSAMISKLKVMNMGSMTHRETGAIRDCIETVGESIYLMKQSIKEMEDLGTSNWGMQMSDLQTWVSAALTNEDTCMDGFTSDTMDGSLEQEIRSSIEGVAQLTSNALDFINRLSATRGASAP